MGRRAADVTTPVPVLGVPALVGVRAWKATGGDRTGGALLHTWGLHCSVGVQTSPGIRRPPTQLSDTPSTPSDDITQTSSGYISKETEYSEILLLTKADREKRAILKLRSGESRSKKEVTFQAPGGEAPVDVACTHGNITGTFCYARAIKTNPRVAGKANNVRARLKSSARYINGSVVDSDAIGGISVDDGGDAEAAKTLTSRGGGHRAEGVNTLLLPAAQPLVMPRQTCRHCGGRQTVIGAAILGDIGPAADALTWHADTTRTLKPSQRRIPESGTNTGEQMHNLAKTQMLRLNDEAGFGKQPPPHPATILRAKRVTVTKATIETTHGLQCFAKGPLGSKIPRPTSLTLTSHAATKRNGPHSHTLPRPLKTAPQHTASGNVCVSVHASPPRSPRNTQKCEETRTSHRAGASETTTQASPAAPSSDPAHDPQVKLPSKVQVHPSAFTTFKVPQHTSTPQLGTVVPRSTLNLNATSPQTHAGKSDAARIQPLSSNSEPSLHAATASGITTPTCPDSRAKLPVSLSSTSARYSAAYEATALRNLSVSLKNTPASVSCSPATLTDNQTSVCGSRTALLQSADTRQRELRDARVQTGDESGAKGSRRSSGDASKVQSRRGDAGINPDTDKSKCNGNLINELVVHEPQDHGNSNLSQVTNLQNYISLMKPGSSCLRGCINTEQQRQAHYQGYTETEHGGHCGPCPPVKAAQETELKTERFALGKSARHANIKLKSNADKQTRPNYSSASTVAQTNCVRSSPASANVHVDPSAHCGASISSLHTGAPAPVESHRAPSPTHGLPPPASRPTHGAGAQLGAGPAHSHPAGAALLLPPSPQCGKSAALHQRLETVEASLAANKARITTLLNIIHDLEMCHTPTSG